jgi:hypothetical protein
MFKPTLLALEGSQPGVRVCEWEETQLEYSACPPPRNTAAQRPLIIIYHHPHRIISLATYTLILPGHAKPIGGKPCFRARNKHEQIPTRPKE